MSEFLYTLIFLFDKTLQRGLRCIVRTEDA